MGLIFKNISLKSATVIDNKSVAGMVITDAAIYTSSDGITWASTGVTPASTYGGNSSGDRFLHGAGSAEFRSYKLNGSYVATTSMPSNLMRPYRNGTTGTIIARNFGSVLYRSTNDGLSWNSVLTVSPTSIFNSGLHYGNGVWFHSYVNTTPTPRTQHHLRSTDDGLTWSSVGITGLPADSAGGFGGFTRYMNGLHWAYLPPTVAEASGTRVYTSTDALTWTQVGTLSGGTISATGGNYGDESGVFYRGGFYYTKNTTSPPGLARSSNGFTFTAYGVAVTLGVSTYSAVGYMPGPGLWLLANYEAANSFARIWTTPDPTTTAWTLRYSEASIVNTYPFSAFGFNQSDWNSI